MMFCCSLRYARDQWKRGPPLHRLRVRPHRLRVRPVYCSFR